MVGIPIKDWDVTAIKNMKQMFYAASAFNQDISKWDVSAVTDTRSMFSGASSFNQDLSKWDVSAVTDMSVLFSSASAFNQDLSKWDVSNVMGMGNMFHGASAFNRELCGDAWVNSKAEKTNMFEDSPGSILETKCKKAKTGYDRYGERYGEVGG